MANVNYGSRESFREGFYFDAHPDVHAYMEKFNERFDQYVAPSVKRFMETSSDVYNAIDRSESLRRARAFGRRMGTLWQTDEIRELRDIGEFQNCPPVMRRWIMAEPEVRQLYHRQQATGYGEDYSDMHPTQIGESHYDYRRATDGMVMEKEDGTWECTNYFDDLIDPKDDLDYLYQCDILNSWAHMRRHLAAKRDDPTSPFNASL